MVLAREQGLVEDGHLQQRDLQASDQGLQGRGDGLVVEDIVEEQGDELEHEVVHLVHPPREPPTAQLVQHVHGAGGDLDRVELETLQALETLEALHARRALARLEHAQRAQHLGQGDRRTAPREGHRLTGAGGGGELLDERHHVRLERGADRPPSRGVGGPGRAHHRPAEVRALDRGQDVAAREVVVQGLVEPLQVRHQVPVEELQDQQLNREAGLQGGARLAHGLADRLRGEGVAGALEIGVAEEVADPAVECVELVLVEPVGLGHHVLDRDGDLELVVLHQSEGSPGGGLAGRAAKRRGARRAALELLLELGPQRGLHPRAPQAHVAHGVEVDPLLGVVLRLVGELEQGVVEPVQGVGREALQRLERHLAAAAQVCRRARRRQASGGRRRGIRRLGFQGSGLGHGLHVRADLGFFHTSACSRRALPASCDDPGEAGSLVTRPCQIGRGARSL